MSNKEEIMESVYTRFLRSVNTYGDRPFLHIPRQATRAYSDSAIDFTYNEMLAAVELLRAQYIRAGYKLGNRVALLLENRAEFFQHFYALNALGVCVVPINAEFVVDEMAYLIGDSDVSVVVSLPAHVDKLKLALANIDRSVAICSIDNMTLLAEAPLVENKNIRKDELADATIVYTSGTTGKPKGCVLSNQFFFTVGDWYLNLGGFCKIETGVDRLITPLPVFHINALIWSMMAMMQSGGCLIQLDRFHSSTWWETVRESGATILHYLGVMPAMLLNLPETELDFNDQIKFGLGGGVEPDLHARFEQRYGFPLIEGWAMTETGSGVCFMCNREPRHVGKRCMGRVEDDMDFRIVDDSGNDVAIGEAGELLVRRRHENYRHGFFTEYYKNPEATADAWKDNWFHTGDVVSKDMENSVFFIERKKNIIRRSGENIAAAEVETVLIDHPAVANCAVAAVPDPVREEEVAACVILNHGYTAESETARMLVNYCLERLSYFKVPGYVIFIEALPVTSTQKIQRGELRKLCLELLDSQQCTNCCEMKKKKKN